MIFLLHLPLLSQIPGFLCDRKNTVRLVSPQQEMKVWTKAGPSKLPFWHRSAASQSVSSLGYPEGLLEISGP